MSLPLRIGSDSEFLALRRALETAGYTEPAVRERLGLERMGQYRLEGARHLEAQPDDALGLLIWVLLEGGAISLDATAKLPLAELRALEVVVPQESDPQRISATVMLYPVQDLYAASDRSRPVDDQPAPPPDDFVYPAIVPNTEQYLGMLSFTPCEAFLDLCAGTGIAAMVAVRNGAKHAWAYDVTERSTHFAEFNKRLNGIANMTAAKGDLYEPAGNLTFDRIAAHAPYVPVFRHNMVFDSGGQDGEQIVRRVIEGLPKYLRPGARFYAPLVGTDRDEPFEMRLRNWLGPAEEEFDIAFFVNRIFSPSAYVAEAISRNRAGIADAKPWRELFEQLRVKQIARGFLIIQRKAQSRPVFTVRRQVGPRSGPHEQHWVVDWETSVTRGVQSLLAVRLRASRDVHMRVEHRLTEDGWAPQSYTIDTEYPFVLEIPVQAWTAHLLALADGSHTAAELLDLLKQQGAVHANTPAPEFAQVIAQLISGGFLELTEPRQ
ncbi:MAG TPA: 50S ribosomal protein L11 methyltransferase [Bryobacteraceae bacterium]|jgi:methylase of polypeptide subunit release factors